MKSATPHREHAQNALQETLYVTFFTTSQRDVHTHHLCFSSRYRSSPPTPSSSVSYPLYLMTATSNTRKPYSGTNRALVLALDIGTTFSGVSYAILEPGEVPKIHGVTRCVSLSFMFITFPPLSSSPPQMLLASQAKSTWLGTRRSLPLSSMIMKETSRQQELKLIAHK